MTTISVTGKTINLTAPILKGAFGSGPEIGMMKAPWLDDLVDSMKAVIIAPSELSLLVSSVEPGRVYETAITVTFVGETFDSPAVMHDRLKMLVRAAKAHAASMATAEVDDDHAEHRPLEGSADEPHMVRLHSNRLV